MGRSENSGFFRNNCSQLPEIEYMKVCKYFLTLAQNIHVCIQKIKPDFLGNYFADLNQIFMKGFMYKEI